MLVPYYSKTNFEHLKLEIKGFFKIVFKTVSLMSISHVNILHMYI